jgi:hypothetical protein
VPFIKLTIKAVFMFVAAASLLSFNLLLVVEEIVSDGTTCENEDTAAVADEALRSLKKYKVVTAAKRNSCHGG